jgi:hypothetical protein
MELLFQFNYPAFCKILSINQVNRMILKLWKNPQSISSQNLDSANVNKIYIIAQEIFKLFINKFSSLKRLIVNNYLFYIPQLTFISYPGTRDCLKNLSILDCRSDICSDFFDQLSQICHNIQSLIITFAYSISSGSKDLISVQKNLKCLKMIGYDGCGDLTDIIPSLTKLSSDTLTKLIIRGEEYYLPFLSSFIAKFINGQELRLSFYLTDGFEDYKSMQYGNFSQIFHNYKFWDFNDYYQGMDLLIKFLETRKRFKRILFM